MKLMLGKATSFWLKKKYFLQYMKLSCIGLYSGVSFGHWQHGGGGSKAVWELDSDFNTLATDTVP